MAGERFSREGLKKAAVTALRHDLDDSACADAIEREFWNDARTCKQCIGVKAALDYLDRFNIKGCYDDIVCVTPKPATNPRVAAAAKRVAEAQENLKQAQADLEAAQREGR